MKYTLINLKTKEETLCDKVEIDGFYYYIGDVVTDIKTLNVWHINCTPKFHPFLKFIGSTRYAVEEFEKGNFRKLISSNNPNIDIPKVVDEVDNLGYKHCDTIIPKDITRSFHYSFKCGYNKSQESHPFSSEDMISFYKWLNKNGWQNFSDIKEGLFINSYGVQKQDKELIQLWKEEQPKIIYYK
jgi:hypothetical protein